MAGIDVGGIIIGSEIPDEALARYNTYVRDNVFPPKYPQSLSAAVADGGSKVLSKCGENEGSPRKGRDGAKLNPKPYWGGRFFFVRPKNGRILRARPMRSQRTTP